MVAFCSFETFPYVKWAYMARFIRIDILAWMFRGKNNKLANKLKGIYFWLFPIISLICISVAFHLNTHNLDYELLYRVRNQNYEYSRIIVTSPDIRVCEIDIGNSKYTKLYEIGSGTKLFITFELKVIRHEERVTQSFYADCF